MFGRDSIFGERDTVVIPGLLIVFWSLYDFQSPRALSSVITFPVSTCNGSWTSLLMLRNSWNFGQGEEVAILVLYGRFWFLILKINMKMWCKKEVEGSMEGRLYRVLAAVASWRW